MLLVIDVGNTHTVLGLYQGTELVQRWRLSTQPHRTADEHRLLLEAVLARYPRPEGAALSSVVPPAATALRAALAAMVDGPLVVVGPGVRTGMALQIDNPREVGADRVVNAIGAVARFGAPVVVVDFGTATTVDLVGDDGAYRGGAIAPGVEVAAEALVEHTAALRRVELSPPAAAVGRNTVEAIQSGLVYGYAALVDGLVERIVTEEQLGSPPLVATGGLAEVIVPVCRHRMVIDDELTLRGLRIVYQRNTTPGRVAEADGP
jgi:type III pantothenate kinase